jgi:hypothetical protein
MTEEVRTIKGKDISFNVDDESFCNHCKENFDIDELNKSGLCDECALEDYEHSRYDHLNEY